VAHDGQERQRLRTGPDAARFSSPLSRVLYEIIKDGACLRELFAAAKEPKRWIEVEGAGHYDLYQALFARLEKR
jgi:hypothetical protein